MFFNEDMAKYAAEVQEELKQLIRDLCAIPAPSHHEEKRAEFCKKWFEDNGFTGVFIDEALNVIAPLNVTADNPLTVIMAHTDTVFPDTEPMPFSEDGEYMYSPGVGDDTANLAVLMICARYYKDNFPGGSEGMLIVANSCEEGLGNLKGSRRIVADYGSRITDFISLDGATLNRVVTRAVGSHRYKVTVRTEGGHSFGKFGNRNAIHVLSSMITSLYAVKVPQHDDSITTYNVGHISGGTSVNTIAQNAEMMYEYRSNDRECLAKMKNMFEKVIEFYRATGVEVEVELIGDRPCGGDVDPVKLEALRNRFRASVKDIFDLETINGSSSTDCNIPLSEGIPAICFGVCRAFGSHTREEKVNIASLQDGCRLLLDFLYRK